MSLFQRNFYLKNIISHKYNNQHSSELAKRLLNQIKEKHNCIPIFIFPPEQINPTKNKYFSNNSVQFMIESLHELSESIKNHNGKIYFFKGDNMKVIKSINKLIKII